MNRLGAFHWFQQVKFLATTTWSGWAHSTTIRDHHLLCPLNNMPKLGFHPHRWQFRKSIRKTRALCQVLEEKLLGTGSDAPPRDHTDGDRTDAVDGMPEPLPLTVAKVGDRTALS